jgi:acetate---CoA ligase (ADP-forming)
MTAKIEPERMTGARPARQAGLAAMLEARSVAVVGASQRPGSFGERMLAEVAASQSRPQIYPVNPRYPQIGGRQCYPSLADLPGPVDLVLLGVPDAALEAQLTLAARRGDRSAVIFGNAHEGPGPPGPAGQPHTNSDPAANLPDPGAGRGPGRRPVLRERLAAIASSAGMELCGAGCMGFANVTRGLRAMGYTEPDPLPAGPVALVTHSGSVFSAMLRLRRAIGFTLAVSSGQELVTTAPSYLDYALGLPGTRVLALVLEAIRQPDRLRQALARAAERDIPVVLLTVGNSARGAKMVAAHSGALAAADGGWEALSRAYGLHRVGDLAELTDTLELFAIGRRPPRPPSWSASRPRASSPSADQPPAGHSQADPPPADQPPADQPPAPRETPGSCPARGIATVHDSGLERAHAADLADQLGVPFAQLSAATRARLQELLDPGLEPGNPLDVWGTGADTVGLFAGSLTVLADDPSVVAVALAVDLVSELDGDDSYPLAALDAARRTDKPLVIVSNLPSAIDQDAAAQLRQAAIPVLEGLRPGLLALGHLLDHTGARSRYEAGLPAAAAPATAAAAAATANPAAQATANPAAQATTDPAARAVGIRAAASPATASPADEARRRRGRALLAAGAASGAPQRDLLREYGIAVARVRPAGGAAGALAAAELIGYPVVLKTDEPAIQHKSDAGGVVLGVDTPDELIAAYADLAARLGPRVLVCETVPSGVELALGIARDPALGPLIVVGAGGVLVEAIADRAVALPPVSERTARQLLGELRISRLLAGFRGAPPADLGSIVRAVTGLSALAVELGSELEALDVNPLICGPGGAVAVDALAIGADSVAA